MDAAEEERFLSTFREELQRHPRQLESTYRGPGARGGQLLRAKREREEARRPEQLAVSSSASTAQATGVNTPASSRAADEDFWERLGDVLKKHFPEAQRSAILRSMMRDHLDYVGKLSLDEIELIAGDQN
mmetsp:Transcript_416/g.1423  ORF Transcript_416/g.1423 Transcript_416/m.1423 type:complete len:130 (+) Transcript_416:243-632(+)